MQRRRVALYTSHLYVCYMDVNNLPQVTQSLTHRFSSLYAMPIVIYYYEKTPTPPDLTSLGQYSAQCRGPSDLNEPMKNVRLTNLPYLLATSPIHGTPQGQTHRDE